MGLCEDLIYEDLALQLMSVVDAALKKFDYNAAMQSQAIKVLGKIYEIVQNTDIDDCAAMEEIVCIFQEYGLDSGYRHDF